MTHLTASPFAMSFFLGELRADAGGHASDGAGEGEGGRGDVQAMELWWKSFVKCLANKLPLGSIRLHQLQLRRVKQNASGNFRRLLPPVALRRHPNFVLRQRRARPGA